mmetsp:Transcript_19939/g.69210  ORF Transcript_19939/g.69210 Transcript_19939/m.69210 type:complete len:572 (-) Transcript_19939:77-1792(-)
MPAVEKSGVRMLATEPQRRKNGFGWPLHPLQAVSWVVAGLDVGLFAVFCLPLYATATQRIIISVFYALSVILMAAAAWGATIKDPVDPKVLLKDSPPVPIRADSETDMTDEFCSYCDVHVQPRSKHCRECNKCVDVFDHHCMWLNNCIGKKNYLEFLLSITGVAAMVGIVLGTCIYLLYEYCSEEDRLQVRLQDLAAFESLPKEFILGVIIFLVIINLPLFLLDVQLIILHIFLMSQELTTYEYIMVKSGRLELRNTTSRPSLAGTARLVGRKIPTLPAFMDWIVFAGCCKKRRKHHKEAAVRPECGQESGAGQDAEAGVATGSHQEQQCLGVPIEDPAPLPINASSERVASAACSFGPPLASAVAAGVPTSAAALSAAAAPPAAAAAVPSRGEARAFEEDLKQLPPALDSSSWETAAGTEGDRSQDMDTASSCAIVPTAPPTSPTPTPPSTEPRQPLLPDCAASITDAEMGGKDNLPPSSPDSSATMSVRDSEAQSRRRSDLSGRFIRSKKKSCKRNGEASPTAGAALAAEEEASVADASASAVAAIELEACAPDDAEAEAPASRSMMQE